MIKKDKWKREWMWNIFPEVQTRDKGKGIDSSNML